MHLPLDKSHFITGMLFSVPVCAVLFSLYLEFMKKATQKNDDKHTGL